LGRVLGAENVVIQLRTGTNYILGGSTSRSIRINDDEGDTALPAVGFLLGTSTVREDAGSAFIYVRVTANPATNKPVTVDYRISGGTAIPNVNYVPGTFQQGLQVSSASFTSRIPTRHRLSRMPRAALRS